MTITLVYTLNIFFLNVKYLQIFPIVLNLSQFKTDSLCYLKATFKDRFPDLWKFSHYLLILVSMERAVKFRCPQTISGASQQNSVAGLPSTTEEDGRQKKKKKFNHVFIQLAQHNHRKPKIPNWLENVIYLLPQLFTVELKPTGAGASRVWITSLASVCLHLLQLFRRKLQLCFAVKLQKCFVDFCHGGEKMMNFHFWVNFAFWNIIKRLHHKIGKQYQVYR